MATAGQAAAHIFLNERNFYEMLNRGVIERQDAGAYDLEIVREEYIRHLQRVAAGRERKNDKIDGDFERARKDKELADRTALQNALTRGELVPVSEVQSAWTKIAGIIRTRVNAIPNRIAPVVSITASASECERLLRVECAHALEEISATHVEASSLSESAQGSEGDIRGEQATASSDGF